MKGRAPKTGYSREEFGPAWADVDRNGLPDVMCSAGRGLANRIKHSGIDNELYTDPKTGMLFADAREGLAQLVSAVKLV